MSAQQESGLPEPAEDDPTTIAVRAYVERQKKGPRKHTKSDGFSRRHRPSEIPNSDYTLVFDTETNLDAAQDLRFGTYQVRDGDELDEEGIFFDPARLPKRDQELIRHYAAEHGLEVRTLEDFIEEVFFKTGYDLGAMIVGLNLPFDISRIARAHATARTRSMRGGFSFELSANPRRARVQVKRLSATAPTIRFTIPEYRQVRRRGNVVPSNPGYFVDVRALAAALTNRSFSLKGLAEFLQTKSRKLDSKALFGPVTEDTIRYAVRDTQVTWECYRELRARYLRHGLADTPIYAIHSVASIGKAYLTQMNVSRWRKLQDDFSPALIGKIMSTYYGGRSEVHLRRMICRVIYCDFLSMYPTVCGLMGLWRYVTAQGMTPRDATADVRELLAAISLNDLQHQETWQKLLTIVRIRPRGDILPVRAKYGTGTVSYNIGLNYLTSKEPLWFTLADCIAAKILTGKVPEVMEAVRFEPMARQKDLRPVLLAGNPEYHIDPAKDDFFRRVIDLRVRTKARMKAESGMAWRTSDADQEFLKILANSTAYGISVQMDPDEPLEPEILTVYGPRDRAHTHESRGYERPGPYFHPLLATVTTGAARLMLAIAERLILNAGLDWAFCDTDSMAIANPDALPDKAFVDKVEAVRGWFTPLNPYETKGPLLKIEEVNYAPDRKTGPRGLTPLYCYAVSAKRYALFNLDERDRPILRKASAHGLGHLMAPTDD